MSKFNVGDVVLVDDGELMDRMLGEGIQIEEYGWMDAADLKICMAEENRRVMEYEDISATIEGYDVLHVKEVVESSEGTRYILEEVENFLFLERELLLAACGGSSASAKENFEKQIVAGFGPVSNLMEKSAAYLR